jgi:outer membrane protein TolC
MVGMNLNVPIRNARRRAAVREAMFRLNQRRAEFDAAIDMIQNDVQASYERARESHQAVELYRQSILPTASQNVEAARAGYTAATVDFLRLIEAQRQLIALEEKSYEAEADYHGRLAELERAVGGPISQIGSSDELAIPIP